MGWADDTNWKFPTTHTPSVHWVNEEKAYDGDADTFAAVGSRNEFLELGLSTPILCEAIRFFAYTNGRPCYVDLDVYYDGAWCDVYDGEFPYKEWSVFYLPEAYQALPISWARISLDWGPGGGGGDISVFQFKVLRRGGWGQLLGMKKAAEEAQPEERTLCPLCGYPLEAGTHCLFCGWTDRLG
jgi:hypothetical protein